MVVAQKEQSLRKDHKSHSKLTRESRMGCQLPPGIRQSSLGDLGFETENERNRSAVRDPPPIHHTHYGGGDEDSLPPAMGVEHPILPQALLENQRQT